MLVRSRVDFSVVAITNINSKSLLKLQQLQRLCLITATKCLAQTSGDLLDIISQCIPIDLHLRLKSAEALVKIKSKQTPVYHVYNRWFLGPKVKESTLTTFSKMRTNYRLIMKSNKNFEVPVVQMWCKEFPPFVDDNIIKEYLKDKDSQILNVNNNLNNYDVIICTDGSTLMEKNHEVGKSGSAAIIYLDSINNIPTIIKEGIGTNQNNYVAEIYAIKLGLNFILDQGFVDKNILVMSDCLSASEAVFTNKLSSEYNSFIRESKMTRKRALLRNNIVSNYIPAHKGFIPNELADKNAKESAASTSGVLFQSDRKQFILQLRKKVLSNWNFRFNIFKQNKWIAEIINNVNEWNVHSIIHPLFLTFNQLLSSHNKLNYSRYRMGMVLSPNCSKCGEPESVFHFVFHCERYTRIRRVLLNKIRTINKNEKARWFSEISFSTLCGQRNDVSLDINKKLLSAFLDFLKETGRF